MPPGCKFGKLIIFGGCIITANGTASSSGLSNGCDGEELFPRGREAAAHAARHLLVYPEVRGGTRGETHRPLGQGSAVDGCREGGAGLCAPLRKPARGARKLAGRDAR